MLACQSILALTTREQKFTKILSAKLFVKLNLPKFYSATNVMLTIENDDQGFDGKLQTADLF